MIIKSEQIFFKRLGPRVDWITLSYPTQYSSRRDLQNIAELVVLFFSPLTFESQYSSRAISYKAEGIFIRVVKNNVSIQLQGHLFTVRENFFSEARIIAKKLASILDNKESKINPLLHISRLDICQDFIGAVPSLFREFMDEKYDNPLNCSFENYSRLKNRVRIDTGFLLKNKNWEIGCYRKDIENKLQKNREKQKIETEKYDTSSPVTRIELRLTSSEKNILATFLFYNDQICEDEFCKKLLAEWCRSKMIRIPSPTDKKRSRWLKHPFYHALFILKNQEAVKASDIIGCSKSLIQYNPEIAKRSLQSSMNNVVDILDKIKSRSEFQRAIEKAEATKDSRKRFKEKKKEESSKFFERLLNGSNEAA